MNVLKTDKLDASWLSSLSRYGRERVKYSGDLKG